MTYRPLVTQALVAILCCAAFILNSAHAEEAPVEIETATTHTDDETEKDNEPETQTSDDDVVDGEDGQKAEERSTEKAEVKVTEDSQGRKTTKSTEQNQSNSSAAPSKETTKKNRKENEARALDVITIIGNADKLKRTSGSAHRISGKTLESQEHDDVHRVLKQVPGVYIRDEEGFGLRPNIGLRGASSDRSAKVSLMEDGVLMAPAPYAAPAAYYFPLTTRLNGLEVFKGPASIKYGPNTIGGAVNFSTRPAVGRGTKGTIDLAYGNFGSNKIHGHFGQGFKYFGYVLEGARIATDGFKALDNGADTGFEKQDWMLKLRANNNVMANVYHRFELKLGLATEYSNETYLGLTDADFEATPYRRYAASQLGNMDWTRTQAKLAYTGLVGEDLEWNVIVYRHNFERAWKKLNGLSPLSGVDLMEALRDPDNPRFRPFVDVLRGASEWSGDEEERLRIGVNDRSYFSQGVQADIEWTTRSKTLRNTIEVGVRAHQDHIRREHTEAEYDLIEGVATIATQEDFTRRNTGEAVAFSAYLFDEFSWRERIILTPGVRMERYQMALTDRLAQTPSDRNEELVLLPGLGIWGQVSPNIGLLAGVHKGFSPVSPGQSPDTKSETSINYESGVRWDTGAINGEVVGFFNNYENLTGTCTQSSGCQIEDVDLQFNAGQARILGFESLVAVRFGLGLGIKTNLKASYTYTDARFLNNFASGFSQWGEVAKNDELPYIPKHQAGVEWQIKKGPMELNLSTSYVSDMRDVAGQDDPLEIENIPGYTVFDALMSYRAHRKTKIYLKGENLLNQAYMVSRRPYGARPGRPFQMMVGVKQSL